MLYRFDIPCSSTSAISHHIRKRAFCFDEEVVSTAPGEYGHSGVDGVHRPIRRQSVEQHAPVVGDDAGNRIYPEQEMQFLREAAFRIDNWQAASRKNCISCSG